jgi:hypothetical protein
MKIWLARIKKTVDGSTVLKTTQRTNEIKSNEIK